MCGIAGYYSFDGVFDSHELNPVGKALEHRGPEVQGVFSDSVVGLVHRRLKIIDLSEDANQPMFSEDKRYVILYNGEVYNYNELRRERQIQVKTTSDTEIVLSMLSTDGPEVCNEFNGMFAIAFYDTKEQKLTLIRDRMGVKPLYYFWDGLHFAFASEIKALLQLSYIRNNKSVDYEALNMFLHLGYSGGEKTIYRNIFKVPAGSYMTIDKSGISHHAFWRSYDKLEKQTIDDYYQAKEILRDMVEQSVRYRLKSDVPLGAFLSGGIDSSLVTAVAQRNISSRLKTFTIAFAEEKYDESGPARQVANFLGTDHAELIVTQKDAIELLPSVLDTFDDLFADSSCIPTMLVSKLAKTQVTMALSGDGGDELFMGYGAYNWARRLQNPLLHYSRKPLYQISRLGNSWSKRGGKVVNYAEKEQIPSHIFSQEQCLFSREEISRVLQPEFVRSFSLENENARCSRQLSPMENQALFDVNYYLREDLLQKVDRSSMKYSLEVRVPLLDYNIVEFALNLNENFKVHNGVQKYLLKEVLYDYVPASLFDRPKSGFSIPLCDWLKGDLQFLINDYLNEDLIQKVGIFNPKKVHILLRKFKSSRYNHLYNRIWQMILVQKFMIEKFSGNE